MRPSRTFQAYPDVGGKWRWRCIARNGRITAVSGESFDSKRNAVRAAGREAEALYIDRALVRL